MTDQQQTGGQVPVHYDPEHVIEALRVRLADIVGGHAAAAMVEAARLDAIVRAFAAQSAVKDAQLEELRGKLAAAQQQPAPAGGAA